MNALHIAIPEPASPTYISDAIAYNQRSLPQYLHALHSAGLIPIPIPLHESQERVAKILATCHGVLLPGSGADIDPQKYGRQPIPRCGAPDPARSAVDELLIQDAFNLQKPILAICHGAQALNVWRGGTLIQDIPSEVASTVNHAPGRQIIEAHRVQITPNTRLSYIAQTTTGCPTLESASSIHAGDQTQSRIEIGRVHQIQQINSSHHQAILTPGDNLVISARCPDDNIIEAVELASPDHWVLAIQWHPERSYDQCPFSRAIFKSFQQATQQWSPKPIQTSLPKHS